MTYPLPLSRRTSVNDVEIAWECWGSEDRPTLVIVHGFSGSACDFDHLVQSLVEQGWRVALVEQRGHGRSGRSDAYSLEQLGDDLIALLPHISDQPVTLLGHSMGGYVAALVATRAAELLRQVVLMDTSGWSFAQDSETALFLTAFFDAFDPTRGLPEGVPTGPEDELIAVTGDPEHLTARRAMQKQFDPHALKQLGMQLFGGVPSLRDALATTGLPAVVLVGSEDTPFMSQAADLAAVTKGALHVIDGAHHSPQLTHPVEWLTTLDTLT